MARKKTLPEETPRSPIDFGLVTNGEFIPRDPQPLDLEADRRVHRHADEAARRLGLSRRAFLSSAAGTATALATINALSGCKTYQVAGEATEHPGVAREGFEASAPGAFIVDVQTHHVEASPDAGWKKKNPAYAEIFTMVSGSRGCTEAQGHACLARETYVEEIFARTEIDVALLSGVPASHGENPLDNADIAVTRELVDQLSPNRLLAEGIVLPNLGPGELDAMSKLAENKRIVGWKVYTPWGPDGRGFFLDDEKHGIPFLERAQASGVHRVFLHKGLPWPSFDAPYASPRDLGPAAKRFPGLQLICYHSGYEQTVTEGPYDPKGGGVDRLIASLAGSDIGPAGNVWAELGGTWQLLMTRPIEAAHVLGKLLKAVGEDRILWGSDALFVGTPQPQIDAMRAFQIPVELQEKHGYPALTAETKRKILGGNAAKLLGLDPAATRKKITHDDIAARKHASLENPMPVPGPLGPRTRRELFAHWSRHGGRPG
jgi:predicted TIM-barrel fold metal-dependent hydrolase